MLGQKCEANLECNISFSECRPVYNASVKEYACRCYKHYVNIDGICLASKRTCCVG